jgi:hypothetical protein
MKKNIPSLNGSELRPEYDFSSMKGGIRGKYVDRLRKASNIVLLEPEVAQAFPNSEAVNQALRGILNTTRTHRRTGKPGNRTLRRVPRKRR